MTFLKLARISVFLALSLARLASAANEKTELPSGKEYDKICVQTAKRHGIPNPNDWVWSATDGTCINTVRPEAGMVHTCEPLVKELDDLRVSSANGQDVFQLPPLENSSTELERHCRPYLESRLAGNTGQYRTYDVGAQSACPEGYHRCLLDCGSFDINDPGVFFGCRAACGILCDSGRGGCYGGWCWAGCVTGIPILQGVEWCYTTKGYSQDYKYVSCSSKNECETGWKCAGPCAAF